MWRTAAIALCGLFVRLSRSGAFLWDLNESGSSHTLVKNRFFNVGRDELAHCLAFGVGRDELAQRKPNF